MIYRTEGSKTSKPTRIISVSIRPNSESIKHNSFHSLSGKRSNRITPANNNTDNHIKNTGSNQIGIINSHHKISKNEKKKKCSLKYIIISILTILILSFILIGLLVGLLRRYKSSTTPQINSTIVLRWNATAITLFGTSGLAGNASNQLNSPRDAIAFDKNLLYIADSGNNRIQKYVIGNSNADTVAGDRNGIGGQLENQLNMSSRIFINANGDVFASDTNNNRIQFWANGASNGTTIAGNSTGIRGNTNDSLYSPYGITYDLSSSTLYIADQANNRIMSYASGASSGILVAAGGLSGYSQTQLCYPVGLYFDSFSNSLIIANHVAHNIVRWVLGAKNWTLLAGNLNGTAGNSSTELNFPTDAMFDPMGNLYVADRDNHRIQLFMNGQSTGITIAGVLGVVGANSSLLNTPWSVKLDNQLNLYISDSSNHRIQKFLRY